MSRKKGQCHAKHTRNRHKVMQTHADRCQRADPTTEADVPVSLAVAKRAYKGIRRISNLILGGYNNLSRNSGDIKFRCVLTGEEESRGEAVVAPPQVDTDTES